MDVLLNGTRMYQTLESKKRKEFVLTNVQKNVKVTLNQYAANELRSFAHDGIVTKRNCSVLDKLRGLGLLMDESKNSMQLETPYLCAPCAYEYPLSHLNIEITNSCNLKCKHCYGSFAEQEARLFIPYSWFTQSLDVFNRLHINSFALTGGEATCNPDFLNILKFLLRFGFRVCVFTNAYNTETIKKMLEETKDYRYIVKVSLDGFADVHNRIRGRETAFSHTIESLKLLSAYPNITLYISTVIMRDNLFEYAAFKEYVKSSFPTATHTADLIFPSGNGEDLAFQPSELEEVYKIVPEVFSIPSTSTRKKLRCSGGSTQCTLCADGTVKICNAASAQPFIFKHNAFTAGLENAWVDCGENIVSFREEKARHTTDCKKCKYKRKCTATDCRMIAYLYNGTSQKSNPITCFSVRKSV